MARKSTKADKAYICASILERGAMKFLVQQGNVTITDENLAYARELRAVVERFMKVHNKVGRFTRYSSVFDAAECFNEASELAKKMAETKGLRFPRELEALEIPDVEV